MTPTEVIHMEKVLFEEGIPGFSELKAFRLVQEELDSPFFSLVSLEDERIGFWLIDPFYFFPQYEFTLKDVHKKTLEIQEGSKISVLNIITVRPGGLSTVNLKAPIIFNMVNNKAKQVILDTENYEVRHPLMQPLNSEK